MSMAGDKSIGGIAIERKTGAASPVVANNRQRHINTALAVVLLGIVALAPVPLGSNRPFFWAMWAAALGLVAFAYFMLLALRGETPRVPLGRLWVPLLAMLGFCGVLVVQMLPVGGPQNHAPPSGQNPRRLEGQCIDDFFFNISKACLALPLEEFTNRAAQAQLDSVIRVDKRHLQPSGKLPSNGRFARARESDKTN